MEIPRPTLQRIDAERTEPLAIPHEYPSGDITGGDVERRLAACEATVDQANADRQWIRDRQRRGDR